MRFNLITCQQDTTWHNLLDVWREADQIEVFDGGWVFDHFYATQTDSTGPCLEGYVTLTALMQATRRLRGGVLVTGMVYRHPAVLAKMVTTLDIVSSGRLELGLGAGWHTEECDALGIDLGSPRARSDRFEEGLEVITRLLTEERSDFAGRHFQLDSAISQPKPVQRPFPPITIGGDGEKRTLPLVARYATTWNFPYRADWKPQLRHKREVLAEECQRIGRDPDEIIISCLLFIRDDDFGRLAAEAAEFADEGIGVAIVNNFPRPMDPKKLEQIAAHVGPLQS